MLARRRVSARGCKTPPLLSRLTEKGLLFHVCLQGFKRIFDDSPSQFFLILWVEIGIAQRIDNFIASYNPVRSHHEGDRDDRADVSSRNTRPLQLFSERCPATRAGSSGGGQDNT